MRFLILFFYLISTLPAFATLNDVDKTQIFNKNILVNGGFENGKQKWTASAGTFTASSTTPLVGAYKGVWNAAAGADTLTTTAIAIKSGYYGRSGVASCVFVTASGTATHTIQAYDGTNILSSTTITSSATPSRSSANFIFPSSGNISLRIYANADEPSIDIDDCYLGPAEGYNIANVSQATFIGSAYFATTANCIFTVTSTSLAALSDADCPGPTVEYNPGPGVIQTTDANAPAVTVNALPPGRYEVIFTGGVANGTSNQSQAMAISDGTTQSGQQGVNGSNASYSAFTVVGYFTYTSVGDRTFQLFASASANAVIIGNNASNLRTTFSIKRFPSSEEQTYTPDKLANSYSGYQDSTCSWARTSATLGDPTADASCVLTTNYNTSFGTVTNADSGGSALPGITFTPSRAGKYYACATFFLLPSSGQQNSAQLVAGSDVLALTAATISASTVQNFNLCGIVNASSTSAVTLKIQTAIASGTTTIQSSSPATHAVDWVIFQIDQSLPSPLIANSVVNPNTGVTQTAVAKLNCDAGSAITSQLGSWVSSIGNISTGACAITLTSGTFSATPYCVATSASSGGISTGLILNVDATSSTAVSVDCEDDASTACTAVDFILMCMGSK